MKSVTNNERFNPKYISSIIITVTITILIPSIFQVDILLVSSELVGMFVL